MGLVACVVALSACSGGGGGGPSGGACTPSPNACPDGCNPCTKLSDAQVAAVVGQSVEGQWDSDACEWDFNDAMGNLSFEVSLHINIDRATFEDECSAGGAPVDGITVTSVSGVGDDACYLSTTAGALGSYTLKFLKGCDAYSIDIDGPVGNSPPFTDQMVRDFEKTLALDAVANL